VTQTILPEAAPAAPSPLAASSTRLIAAIAAVALLAAGAVGYLLTRGSGSPAPATPVAPKITRATVPTTAAQWLSSAFAAAKAQGSAHVDVLNKLHGRIGRYSDDDGPGVGVQRIAVSPGMHAEVRVLPGVTYFSANHAALTGYFGFSAAVADKAADHWLVLHPGQPGYAPVTEGVTFSSMMKEMVVKGPLKLLPARSLHGVRVVGIRGTVGGALARSDRRATATLWVTLHGSHLPVVYEASSRREGTTTTTFSHWGMKVSVSAPTSA